VIINDIINELELQQIKHRMDTGVACGTEQIPPSQTTHYSFEVQVQALLALDHVQHSLQLAELQTIWTSLGAGGEIRTPSSCSFAQ